jgi:hypothetical protein
MHKGHAIDRKALKHLLGRVLVYVLMLFIVVAIIKLVPRIWRT